MRRVAEKEWLEAVTNKNTLETVVVRDSHCSIVGWVDCADVDM